MASNKPADIFWLEIDLDIDIEDRTGLQLEPWEHHTSFQLNEDGEIVTLCLRKCSLTQIPDLSGYDALEYLDLSLNKIEKITGLEKLSNLQRLDLSFNNLSKIEGLENLRNLTDLHLSGNSILEIQGLGHNSNLTSLWLDHNNINQVNGLDNLERLFSLNLSGNNISRVEGLDYLSRLYFLYLGNCQISRIEGLEYLTNLNTLYLGNNNISELTGLEGLKSLTRLSLRNNPIKKLDGLIHLTGLTDLDLSDNKISNWSSIEEKLSQLKSVNLTRTNITSIDDLKWVRQANQLKELHVFGNPFLAEEDVILEEYKEYRLVNHLDDVKTLLAKHEELEHASISYKPSCKVMLLGNHASGKTSFLRDYDSTYKERGSTHLLNIHRHRDGANFYDFGGQDYYHGLYQAFLTSESIQLLFWDKEKDINGIGEERNPSNREQTRLTAYFDRTYWLGQIRYASERWSRMTNMKAEEYDSATYVIQTHADLDPQENLRHRPPHIREELYLSFQETETQGGVKKRYQHTKAYLKCLVSEEVSERCQETKISKVDNALFEYIKKHRRRSKRYVLVQDILEHLRDTLALNITQERLSRVLHQLYLRGEVLYYSYHNELKDYVWLEPSIVVRHIHQSLLTQKLVDNGVCSTEKLTKRFSKDDNSQLLLKLLLEEQVIFLDKAKDVYIVPGYLPLAESDPLYDWTTLGHQSPNFVLKFDEFIPFGLINQLICYYGQKEGALKRYWRNQLVFTLSLDELRVIDKDYPKELHTQADKGRDLSIWINLDFSSLCIGVYIRGCQSISPHVIKLAERHLLDDIISFYWRETPLPSHRGQERGDQEGEEPTDDTSVASLGHQEALGAEKFSRRTQAIRSRRDIHDLYLHYNVTEMMSGGQRLFVHLATLDDNAENHTHQEGASAEAKKIHRFRSHIPAYPLTMGGSYRIDQNKGESVPLRLLGHLSTNRDTTKMKRIFISYSKEDIEHRSKCIKFLVTLRDLGLVEYYYDELTRYGDRIHPEIHRQITEADYAFVLVSQNLLATEYITKLELPLMQELGKKIIPIIVSDSTWEHNEIINRHYIARKAKPICSDEDWKQFIKDFAEKELQYYLGQKEQLERIKESNEEN